MKKLFLFTLMQVLLILTAVQLCCAEEISDGDLLELYNNTLVSSDDYENPEYAERVYQDTDVCYTELKTFKFESGDIFEFYDYTFKPGNSQGNKLINGFSIPGSTISIHYYDYASGKWLSTTNINNLPKATLFIDTDKMHLIISVASVYIPYEESHTAVIKSSLEQPLTILKSEDNMHYEIKYTLNSSGNYNGSIWLLKSERDLVDWNNTDQLNIIKADFVINSRFLYDGYYYTEPDVYSPYHGSGSLYRHPSSYSPVVFAHYGSFPAAYDLGYAFMNICVKNQDEKGYWKTGPLVNWLYYDFGIGGGFYDTRFNTDFVQGILYAYKRYNNPEFLEALVKYVQYYYNHAQNYHYETENGGWLVQDYGFDEAHRDTHCSLNHQLAELNLLYNIYDYLKTESCKLLADKMLLAVEDTCDLWILRNNNLKYALYYSGSSNTMSDYPYLTYNDLFTTKQILRDMFGKESSAVNKLMESKLKWMLANGVTGYYTDSAG